MIRKIFILFALISLIFIFKPLLKDLRHSETLNDLSKDYVEGSAKDLESQNVVTSVIVTYRGLDTLGEVSVLFLATVGVGYLLSLKRKKKKIEKRKPSELLKNSSLFVGVIIILFGVYIFTHGHLSPGGGFQGGVLIASAILLFILSDLDFKINHSILVFIESISGATYVVIGILGLVLVGSFLDPRILPMGKIGNLFSAGAIPIIYSLIGLKVGMELINVIEKMKEDE